jgi:hypothetical protein
MNSPSKNARGSLLAILCLAATGLAHAAAPGRPNAQLPTFPQNFDVQGPALESIGFAVTQPGPVVVEVQSRGAAVIVTLAGPSRQPVGQQGSGAIRLSYDVTEKDVQQSFLWAVQIRLAQPAPPQQGGRASGIVRVQSPPVDQAALQRAVDALAAQAVQPGDDVQKQSVAQAAARMDAAFQQQKAQFERQQFDRRAVLLAQVQPQLEQLKARSGAQVTTRGLRGADVGTALPQPLDAPAMQRSPAAAVPAPAPTASASQTLQSAGSTPGPQSVMPNPAIAALSAAQGQPGDPVMINGSGFGNSGGEVHFVVAPGRDLVVPNGVIWNDNQIFASVPDIAGIVGFNGTLYVKRAGDQKSSNLVPFRFVPSSEIRQITRIADATLQQFNGVGAVNYGDIVGRAHGYLFWGPKGNDQLYLNTRLKNGWVVSQPPLVFLPNAYATNGGAYLVESHVGTDRPHVNVGFWMGSGVWSVLHYSISMVIQGPRGVPDGVVVP